MDASVKARMSLPRYAISVQASTRLTNLYGSTFLYDDITLEESRSVSRTDRETDISFIHQELEDIKDALPTGRTNCPKKTRANY